VPEADDRKLNPARIAAWRSRADRYRALAEDADAPGTQLVYRALAACANDVADRLLQISSPTQ
jgi:hypothetical protein